VHRIIAAVLIYCFCCRKKKEETEDEESAALEDGDKNTKTKTTIVDEGNESKVVDEDADAGSHVDAKKMSGSATASRGASLAAESDAEYSNLVDIPTDMETKAT
jgi:archaellum component FlaD/FlaE